MRLLLDHIDRAVRANFVIDKDAAKPLESPRIGYGTRSTSIARIVFVGMAVENGFTFTEICTHLDMTVFEYNSKLRKYQESYEVGKKKMDQLKQGYVNYDKALVADGDLRLYRKTILVRNYINSLQLEALISI